MSKLKSLKKENKVIPKFTFEEAMKKALNTPIKKIKPPTNIKKSGK